MSIDTSTNQTGASKMTNQELFKQAQKSIVDPAGTIKYIKNLATKTGVGHTGIGINKAIDQLVMDYEESKEPRLQQNGLGLDFALYINLIVKES